MRLGAPPTRWALASLLLAFALVLALASAAEPVFPPLSGRVVDAAGILSSATRARLDEMLSQQEQATGQQVVVVTLASLQGYPIEDFGYQLGRHWGIGQKGRDNGVLVIVAPQEHRTRIEVGYGLEDRLTDAQSRIIIEQVMLPSFRRGDFNQGILDGTAAVLRVLGGGVAVAGAPGGGAQRSRATGGGIAGWLFFLVLLIFLGRRMFWGLPLLAAGGGYRSGGFSGGGFSGGGGSFGGGGASGGW